MTSLHPAKPVVFIQERCAKHRYIRNKDTSTIVERPERLRAISLGVATAVARVEAARGVEPDSTTPPLSAVSSDVTTDVLTDALSKLGIAESEGLVTPPNSAATKTDPLSAYFGRFDGGICTTKPIAGPTNSVVELVRSNALVDLCTHKAVDFIHGDEDPAENPLFKLRDAVKNCDEKLRNKESEVPSHLNQGDLYLCPQSLEAISSAVGTVCEAVDRVLTSSNRKAFVAIRPPGHHADEATPSGFCWVNNVAIGAAHAHLEYKVSHVIVLDIDLHHGNGTQAIAWRINEDAYRQQLETMAQEEAGLPTVNEAPLQFYYGSIHDILSYPCEDGKASLVAAASVKIAGPHGQHIENIHLDQYESLENFWKLYNGPYSRLLGQAEQFCQATKASPESTLVFISCGFDACEHEYASMSRHGRHVPVEFYSRFARDAATFADKYAAGKLISVLEGGYSDRALASGALAHVVGLASQQSLPNEHEWWNLDNLVKMEKVMVKKGRKSIGTTKPEAWLERTTAIFSLIDVKPPAPLPTSQAPTPSRMLRSAGTTGPTPEHSQSKSAKQLFKTLTVPHIRQGVSSDTTAPESPLTDPSDGELIATSPTVKKLPRVILHVRPPNSYGP
ncbi:Arginase/deacetylase [Auriculariales sp. MPI-PUGE-AT-0066]|nr:Arginase/deacetylase [Auriculariales sp. MPI-PUGE-AT-0066]